MVAKHGCLDVSDELLQAAEAFVRKELQGHDASHDVQHVLRVASNGKMLAEQEGLDEAATRLITLSCLLHDVRDWKYSGSATATGDAVQAFLASQGAPEALVAKVTNIISTVGFKDELGSGGAPLSLGIEAAIVQDADRLDAIGAVGVARCLTFGGRFNRVLYDPDAPPREGLTKEQYMAESAKATTINHFYEKLFKLKDLMKTQAGRRVAQQRHDFMHQFVDQFLAEVGGRA